MGTKFESAAAVFSLAILLSFTGSVNNVGASIITPGNHPQVDENVLFNEPGLIGTGPVVQGITNNTDLVVTFTGDGEILTTPAAGQARIQAADGSFDFLRVEIIGGIFKSLILNLDALANGNVEFTTDEVGSGPVVSPLFSLSGSGNNFFTITSVVGLEYISLRTDVGVTSIGLEDISQFRIGGAAAVPEPGSLIMWSLITMSASAIAVKMGRKAA
jgi:hypothetical protein